MDSLRYAWRNIWRNGRRSLVTMLAIVVSTGVLIVIDTLTRGVLQRMQRNATGVYTGELQVHAPEFLETNSMYRSLEDPGRILDWAQSQAVGAAARSFGFGLLAHGNRSAGARYWGIDPGREDEVFGLGERVAPGRGSFLKAKAEGTMLLGHKLAKQLGVKTGDELVAVVQAADGSMGNELFRVGGILRSISDELDRGGALLHRDDFQRLFASGGRIHEVALNSHGARDPDQMKQAMDAMLPGADTQTWKQLMPMMADMERLGELNIWFMAGIFYLAVALGVLNTMLMATQERIRELGLTRALGASPLRVVGSLCLEVGLLALSSALVGTLVGSAGALYLADVGLDTRSWGAGETSFGGFTMDSIWYAEIAPASLYLPAIIVTVMSLLAALYPAWVGARVRPVEAMNRV